MSDALKILALAALLASCDDETGITGPDMAAPASDLSIDRGTCLAALFCVAQCTPANIQPCFLGCDARVSTEARPFWDAFGNCVLGTCSDPDAGADSCQAGPGSAGCMACVSSRCSMQLGACMAN